MSEYEQTPAPDVMGGWVGNIAERLTERLESALRNAYEQGFLTLGASKPAQRWAYFFERTPATDWALILDEQYIDKRRAGVAPQFEAERVMNVYREQVAQAVAQGLPVPPEPPVAFPWPVALADGTATIIYELLAADARRLYRQYVRKAMEAVA